MPSVVVPRVGRLHVVTDTDLQSRYTHAELARLAARGGADAVQLRHKGASMRERWRTAEATAEALLGTGASLLIDDHVDVALALGAGVHVGQTDLPVDVARRLLGPATIVGATATTAAQARDAEAAGASYIGFGPVFATSSKANPDSVKGLGGLEEAAEAVRIPVVAIGGITLDRVAEALGAGAWGIAVLSAVVCADDVEAAAAAFAEEVERSTG